MSFANTKMQEITKSEVSRKYNLIPKRRCFAEFSGIQKGNESYPLGSFSVNFLETIKPLFEKETGLQLYRSKDYSNFWRSIKAEEELNKIKEWEEKQNVRVFMRNCLSLSVALSINLEFDDGNNMKHTDIGGLEYEAKNNKSKDAIEKLAKATVETIQSLAYYRDADLICSVPFSKNKDFDLPNEVASLVSKRIGKQNITEGFEINKQKESLKKLDVNEKWDALGKAEVSFNNSHGFYITGKKIILIDDKYQSGTTIQYIAMKLQQAGAFQVYGLNFVKTLRDTDNS